MSEPEGQSWSAGNLLREWDCQCSARILRWNLGELNYSREPKLKTQTDSSLDCRVGS